MGGSSQETESHSENKPPQWWEDAAKKAISVADQINQVGYVPYMGHDLAAFTPMQQAGMQSASDWMSAANGTGKVDAMAGVPKATMDSNGIMGYESATGMMRNLEKIKERFPDQYNKLTKFGGDLLSNPSRSPGSIDDSPWHVGDNLGLGGGGGGGGGGYGPNSQDAANQAANSVRAQGLYSNGDTNIALPAFGGFLDRFGKQDYTFNKPAPARQPKPAEVAPPIKYKNPGKWW